MTLEHDVLSSTMSVAWLSRRARELTGKKELQIWYKKPHTLGKKMVTDESDILEILKEYDYLNFVSIYIVEEKQEDRATTDLQFPQRSMGQNVEVGDSISRSATLRSSKAVGPRLSKAVGSKECVGVSVLHS